MKNAVLVCALICVPLAIAGIVVHSLTSRSHTEVVPEGPFMPTQQPGAVVAANGYHLSGPYTHENLSIFLVHGPETLEGKSFLTLQEGLERKQVVVHETSSVAELAVENRSADQELFIQSGDIVKGGKQDRTLPYDTIVEVNSGRVPINSFCVEQGRWTKRGKESTEYFGSSSSNLATNDLKRAAVAGEASQAAVWTNVAKTQDRLEKKLGAPVKGEASRTSLQLTMESPAVGAAMAPYLKALTLIPDDKPDSIGCVMAVNGRVVSADVYASRTLFKSLWPKLLSAGTVEAFLEVGEGNAARSATEEAARAFLTEAEIGTPSAEAVTQRTYVHVRRSEQVLLMESCDRSRDNLVLHRSFMAR